LDICHKQFYKRQFALSTFEDFKKLFRHWTDNTTWIETGLWQMHKNLMLMTNIQRMTYQIELD